MYEKILNPVTKQFVPINSKEGKRILKNYKVYYNKSGGWNPFKKTKKINGSESSPPKKKRGFFSKMKDGFKKHSGKIATATALGLGALAARQLYKRRKNKKRK